MKKGLAAAVVWLLAWCTVCFAAFATDAAKRGDVDQSGRVNTSDARASLRHAVSLESLPAMVKAYRMGEKAAGTGFDWKRKEDVWEKVKEEVGEVEAEMKSGRKTDLEAEFGDLFFALINAARLYGVDPESALARTNNKFLQRFNYMEEQAAAQGHVLHDLTLDEMEELWQQAKVKE